MGGETPKLEALGMHLELHVLQAVQLKRSNRRHHSHKRLHQLQLKRSSRRHHSHKQLHQSQI